MSNSYKKSNWRPIADSNMREWRAQVNRKLRRKVKCALREFDVDDAILDLDVKDVSDIWGSPSDGYIYWNPQDYCDAAYKFYMK